MSVCLSVSHRQKSPPASGRLWLFLELSPWERSKGRTEKEGVKAWISAVTVLLLDVSNCPSPSHSPAFLFKQVGISAVGDPTWQCPTSGLEIPPITRKVRHQPRTELVSTPDTHVYTALGAAIERLGRDGGP